MKRIVIVILIAALAGFISCDRSTVNNYGTNVTGIAGIVTPADRGEVMAVSGADTTFTEISSDGFFILEGLRAGIYRVIVQPDHFSRRLVSDVIVVTGEVTQIYKITLSSYPYPFYLSSPHDGSVNVSRYSSERIFLYTDEPLDTTTLASATTFDPPLPGKWSTPGNKGIIYIASAPCRIGTTYHLTLARTAKTASGQPLEKELILSFTTEPLEVKVQPMQTGIDGGVLLRGFAPQVLFNDSVSVDSVSRAVRFEPSIGGDWLLERANRVGTYLRFFPTSGQLEPETPYRMIISDQINLIGTVHLATPDTTSFITEPYGVTDCYPRNGQITSPASYVSLEFNTPMDTMSVESAFSLFDADSNLIAGAYHWSGMSAVGFYPESGALQSGRTYRIRLATTARTLSGVNLKREYQSVFLVY